MWNYGTQGISAYVTAWEKWSGVLYKLKTVAGGLGVADPALTSSGSRYNNSGSLENSVQAIYYPAYELEPTTRAAVGLPATIASPLQLSFE